MGSPLFPFKLSETYQFILNWHPLIIEFSPNYLKLIFRQDCLTYYKTGSLVFPTCHKCFHLLNFVDKTYFPLVISYNWETEKRRRCADTLCRIFDKLLKSCSADFLSLIRFLKLNIMAISWICFWWLLRYRDSHMHMMGFQFEFGTFLDTMHNAFCKPSNLSTFWRISQPHKLGSFFAALKPCLFCIKMYLKTKQIAPKGEATNFP